MSDVSQTSASVLAKGRVALVTGAAMGIGLAACKRFASLGLRVCMADLDAEELGVAEQAIAAIAPGGSNSVMALVTDVGKLEDLEALMGKPPEGGSRYNVDGPFIDAPRQNWPL